MQMTVGMYLSFICVLYISMKIRTRQVRRQARQEANMALTQLDKLKKRTWEQVLRDARKVENGERLLEENNGDIIEENLECAFCIA